MNLEQYVEYVPDPSVDLEHCNSSSNYNGYLDASVVCTGARSDKNPCRVSFKFFLSFNRLLWSFQFYMVNMKKRPTKHWCYIQLGLLPFSQCFEVLDKLLHKKEIIINQNLRNMHQNDICIGICLLQF